LRKVRVAKMKWRVRGGENAFISYSGNILHNFRVSVF